MGQTWTNFVVGDLEDQAHSWDEICDCYTRLLATDAAYSAIMRKGIVAFLRLRMEETDKPQEVRQAFDDPSWVQWVRLSGSIADGGGTCRWFRHRQPDFEIDMLYQVGIISSAQQDAIVVFMPEKPGYVQVRKRPETYLSLHPLLRRDRPELSKEFNTEGPREQFVNTLDMQKRVAEVFPHRDGDGEIDRLSAALIEVNESELQVFASELIKGPSCMTELVVSLKNDPKILFSCDSVLAFKLERWLPLLDQWLHREGRHWPSEVMITKCYEERCHIVAKKSPTETVINTEWRLSFSAMETLLFNSFSQDQKVCYYFLKSLFYRHLRGIEDGEEQHLQSYAMKTEMFWTLEQTPASEWAEADLRTNALRVLTRLDQDLHRGTIPNYFLPTMNLINPAIYDPSLINRIAEHVHLLCNDLEAAVPQDLEKMLQLGEAIMSVLRCVLIFIQVKMAQVIQKRREGAGAPPLPPMLAAMQAFNLGLDGLFQSLQGDQQQ